MSREQFVVPSERLLAVFDAEGHADEGTIHAWVDGAFDADEAARVEAHVRQCATCGALVAEARGLVAATSRVLGTLDDGTTVLRTATPVRVARRGAPWWMVRAAAALAMVIGGGTVWWRGARTTEARTTEARTTEARTAEARTAEARTAEARTAEARTAEAPVKGAGATASRVATVPATAPSAMAEAKAAESAAAAVPAPAAAVSAPAAPAAPPTLRLTAEATAADLSTLSRTATAPALITVLGMVVDESARPLEGAQVIVQLPTGSTNVMDAVQGIMTDVNGRFRMALSLPTAVRALRINVRRIGFQTVTTTSVIERDTAKVAVSLVRSVMALQSIATAGTSVTDYSGRGVAGGIAKGIEGGRGPLPMAAPALRTRSSESVRPPRGFAPARDREQYDRIEDNPFLGVRGNPLSTFSIDVDRASFGNVRRFITLGQRPPKDAVRVEELVNYFAYDLPVPTGDDPVRISTEVIAAPWQPKHQLVRVALQSQRIDVRDLPPNNLVFLIDVSGSMNEPSKLPLVKQSLRLLVDQLRPQDRVAIVAYAGAAGLVLPSTSGDDKERIVSALERLEAGGSTAGGAGIQLAYNVAREHFLTRGNNRVILATDGDFNVGVSSDAELERLVEQRRREGTYLTVLGYGTGNYQAAKMEKLAKVGNGNHAYVDDLPEARKVLVEEMGATLLTVANDVKLQVEFNPARVQAYRLIGYENRLLAAEDFTDDSKDAGDLGAGHQVTALYELVPVGVSGTVTARGTDSLRYVTPSADAPSRQDTDELLYVKLRYKRPGESASRLLTHVVPARVASRGSADTRFAAAVASFGMLLRDSEYKGNSSAAQVLEQARAALGNDVGGYRAAFVRLVEQWRTMDITAGERR